MPIPPGVPNAGPCEVPPTAEGDPNAGTPKAVCPNAVVAFWGVALHGDCGFPRPVDVLNAGTAKPGAVGLLIPNPEPPAVFPPKPGWLKGVDLDSILADDDSCCGTCSCDC